MKILKSKKISMGILATISVIAIPVAVAVSCGDQKDTTPIKPPTEPPTESPTEPPFHIDMNKVGEDLSKAAKENVSLRIPYEPTKANGNYKKLVKDFFTKSKSIRYRNN